MMSSKSKTNWLSIALQHFEEAYKTEEFLQLTEEQLSELISSDDLCVNSEETVFHSVVSWVEHDKEHREKSTIDLMSNVRFSFLKPDFIFANRHSLSKTYGFPELLLTWLESLTKLSKRHSERNRNTLGFVSGHWADELNLQTFDPESKKWSPRNIPSATTKSWCEYSAIVIDKKLILAGGHIKGSTTTNIVECFDLQTEKWATLSETEPSSMLHVRKNSGIAELNGDLYVVGGFEYNTRLSTVEKYDFGTCKWQELAEMHAGHRNVSVTVLGKLLYAGSTFIECYDPAENKWTILPDTNERLEHFGLAGVGGYLYAVGGEQNGQKSKTVERFDPSTKKWTVVTPGLDLALSHLTCVSWNNRLIAGGGVDIKGKENTSVLEYNPEKNMWKALGSLVQPGHRYSSSLFTFTK